MPENKQFEKTTNLMIIFYYTVCQIAVMFIMLPISWILGAIMVGLLGAICIIAICIVDYKNYGIA